LPFELNYTEEAQSQFNALSKDKSLAKRFKSVCKALKFLAQDPTHPSLNTHKYDSIEGPEQTEVFEAYAENKTPAAYRIFWCYYPPRKEGDVIGTITILAITPHP
jgi:hypothetical protein